MGETQRLAFLGMALATAAILAGCARTGPPAPVEARGQQRFERPTAPRMAPGVQAAATETQPGTAVVRAGDTLFGIARRHNIPIRAVIDANRLEPPYALQPGQRLELPRVRTHVVQPGDTVYGVSRRHGVEVSALVGANAIPAPYTIAVGQTLILPDGAAEASPAIVQGPAAPAPVVPVVATWSAPIATSSTTPAAVPAAPIQTSPAPEMPIARGVDSAPLPPMPVGPAGPSTSERAAPAPGSALSALLPRDEASAVSAPPQSMSVRPATIGSTTVIAAVPPSAASSSPFQAAPDEAGQATEAALTLPSRGGRFLWPLRGRIVSEFGAKGGGLHNDGINIAAPRGTPVTAADNGVVVYAGNELRGFGNLLLLRHADGWMTAYAHADELLAARGDQVRRGQVIARVGQTGNVTAPQLHFEIRRGKRAVNPREHLASLSADAGR